VNSASSSSNKLNVVKLHKWFSHISKLTRKTTLISRWSMLIFTTLAICMFFFTLILILRSGSDSLERYQYILPLLIELSGMLAIWFLLLIEASRIDRKLQHVIGALAALPPECIEQDNTQYVRGITCG
jgi:hypothetical protein